MKDSNFTLLYSNQYKNINHEKTTIFIYSISFLFFCVQIFSQSYAPTWGPKYKKEDRHRRSSSISVLAVEENYYYMVENRKKSNIVLQYDMSHKLVEKTELKLKHKPRNIVLNKIFETKSGKFGYLSVYDKKEKQWKIFTSKFKDGKFAKVREIYSHEFRKKIKILFLGFTNYYTDDRKQFVVSRDKSHVVFSNTFSTVDKKKKEKIALAVFDADMNLVWKKTQRFKYKDKEISIIQTVVSNNGEVVYMLGKRKNKRKERKRKSLGKYSYKLFRITKDGKKEFNIKIGKKYIATDVGIYSPSENGAKFVVAGFYKYADKKQKKKGIKGVFYASGTDSTGVDLVKIHEFETSFLDGLIREKEIKKGEGLNDSFSIDVFVEFKDGSLGFIAEEYYLTEYRKGFEVRDKTYFKHHSDALVFPRFTKEGALVKMQKILKEFETTYATRNSYTYALHNNKIYLLYNDLKSRKERREMEGNKRHKRSWRYTDLAIINEQGEIEYEKTLFNSKEIELEFRPFFSGYNSQLGKWIIGSTTRGGSKYVMGLIDLN